MISVSSIFDGKARNRTKSKSETDLNAKNTPCRKTKEKIMTISKAN